MCKRGNESERERDEEGQEDWAEGKHTKRGEKKLRKNWYHDWLMAHNIHSFIALSILDHCKHASVPNHDGLHEMRN